MIFFKKIFDYNTKNSYVNRLRDKRFATLKDNFELLIQQKNSINILDIGGEYNYWQGLNWDTSQCRITLLNLTEITIPDSMKNTFSSVAGNAMNLDYEKGDFDIIYSNSVIEHMGSIEGQEKFADEVMRVCDRFIIQTPSLWFPLEPHCRIPFFQFIPHFIRAFLIMWFKINYFPQQKTYSEAYRVSKTTLLFTKSRLKRLFPNCECKTEKLFGLPKSYIIVKM